MKKVLFAAAFVLFAFTQTFAIVGAGMHYVMNTGSLKSSSDAIDGGELGDITVKQEKADGLQGIGFKAWLDILPFVDIEGTFNVAATRYRTSLTFEKDPEKTPMYLEYAPDAPFSMVFSEASPIYGIVNGDLSVTYPFDIIPIVRPYVGAGISYFASIPVVDAKFTKKMIKGFDASSIMPPIDQEDPQEPSFDGVGDELKNALIKTLKDSDYNTGFGGHIIAGVRVKPPIPFAVYANVKYYFGGGVSDYFTQGAVFELGGGFAL